MSQNLSEQLNELLDKAVAAGTEQHRELSFERVGYGTRPRHQSIAATGHHQIPGGSLTSNNSSSSPGRPDAMHSSAGLSISASA